jgi:hypothetical protein
MIARTQLELALDLNPEHDVAWLPRLLFRLRIDR